MNQNRCFPTNTVAWLKQKAQNDANFLPRLIASENYNKLVERLASQNQSNQKESSEEKASKIAQNIWKNIQTLAESSNNGHDKQLATNFIEHLRKSWREEKEEFMRNNPNLQAMPIKPIPKKYDVSKFSDLTEIEGRKIDTHCSICFELYEPDNLLITTVCVHSFHKQCLEEWLVAHNNCPLCRVVVE
jgi:hypothetical protein